MDQKNIDTITSAAIKLTGLASDYDALCAYIGDAQIVMMGEASHGTREFYDIRAQISQRLIVEKGFNTIAIEGDWPDAYHVNKYIRGQEQITAAHALSLFDHFPTWMWRNASMIRHIEWMKEHNKNKQTLDMVGFYGLDVYSLYRSIEIVIKCLQKIDPEIAAEARHAYSCFDHYRQDPQLYGYSVFTKVAPSCAYDVVDELKRVQEQNHEWLEKGRITADESFYIEQNARVIKNAEAYYRALFIDDTQNSWNLRDSHMVETLNAIIKDHQLRGIANPKIVIWAHNSHVGDARATQMGAQGEHNIGQLVKVQFGSKAVSIGFTTYEGTVSAASNWHEPVERKQVRKAIPESYEALFHAVGIPNFILLLQDKSRVPAQALERAIGVVYRPETELVSHYFKARLAEQFDAVIHCDKTEAVEPLEKTSRWIEGEVPETYPSGM